MTVDRPTLNPRTLTWTALLARWIEFAQASLALPKDATGDAWRRSVSHIINLQAVTFALADLDGLPSAERALALDKAELLIGRSEKEVGRIWEETGMPPSLQEMIGDARIALQAASRLAIE